MANGMQCRLRHTLDYVVVVNVCIACRNSCRNCGLVSASAFRTLTRWAAFSCEYLKLVVVWPLKLFGPRFSSTATQHAPSPAHTRGFWKKREKRKSMMGGTVTVRPFISNLKTMSPSSANGVAIAGSRNGHRTAAAMGSRAANLTRAPPSVPYQIDLSTSKTGR